MRALDWLHVVEDFAAHAGLWASLCTFTLTFIVGKIPRAAKARFALAHPAIWAFVDAVAGLFANQPHVKRALRDFAIAIGATRALPIINAFPSTPPPSGDGWRDDEITLTPPPPAPPPLALPTAPPPPPLPPPPTAVRRPGVDGRHALSGAQLPPEATETLAKKLCDMLVCDGRYVQ